MLAHRVLSWFSEIRHSDLNSERKLVFTVLTLPITKRLFYQFFTELALIEHRHISWLTFQHVHFDHVHRYSMIIIWVYRKERNVRVPYVKQMFIAVLNSPICGHFFFLSFFIHTYSLWLWYKANICSFWEDLMFQLSFSKSILNYAPNTVASYNFIFIFWCCFSNYASWCAWFFFSFAVMSLGFK